jgi:hypothetical protein
MLNKPYPLPHSPSAKQDAASLLEVGRWIFRALKRERFADPFLTAAVKDARGIGSVIDSTTLNDIPDDTLRVGIIVTLYSGQTYRVSIEEK